jgi:integrase
MELSVKEYLDSVANPNTRKEYRIGINKFCEWFGKSPRDLLEMRKDDLTQRPEENIIEYRNRAARFEKEIEKFHSYLLKPGSRTEKQGYKINTARTLTLGIRQLFRYYQMPVRIRAGSKVNKTVKTDSSFPLRIIHIRKMFEVADLKAKVILSTATDLGLRISDFIKIKKSDLPSLRAETPIAFEVMTKKEETIAYGFLSDETVQLLKLYLPTLKSENLYLFPSNGKSHVSDEWLNRLLKKLADKAQIDLNGKSLTFHVFRKMFLSTSIDSGIGLTAGKKLCGKAISQSDDTYLTTVKLRAKFIQLKRFLTIQKPRKPANHKQLEAFEDVVSKLQKDLTQQKLITDTITKVNLRMEKELKYLGSQEYMNKLFDEIMKMLADFNSYSKRYDGHDKPSF